MVASLGDNNLYKKYLERISQMYTVRTDIRMFTEIILSATAIIVFFSFAIRPTLRTIAGLWKDIQTKEEVLTSMQTKIDNLQIAEEIYEQERVRISLLNQAIPPRTNVDQQIRQIEGLAKRHGLTLIDISGENIPVLNIPIATPEIPETAEGVEGGAESSPAEDFNDPLLEETPSPAFIASTFYYQFDAIGEYDQVISFLSDFENARRPTLPDTVTVSLSVESQEIRLSIKGSVPYLSQ